MARMSLRRDVFFLLCVILTAKWMVQSVTGFKRCVNDHMENVVDTSGEHMKKWNRKSRNLISNRITKLRGCELTEIENSMLSIRNGNRQSNICQGIAISKYFGLTASHCLYNWNGNQCYDRITASHSSQHTSDVKPLIHGNFRVEELNHGTSYAVGVVVSPTSLHRGHSLKCLLQRSRDVPGAVSNGCMVIEKWDNGTEGCSRIKVNLTNVLKSGSPNEASIMTVKSYDNSTLTVKSGSPVVCQYRIHSQKKWFIRGITLSNLTEGDDNMAFVSILSDHAVRYMATCQCGKR